MSLASLRRRIERLEAAAPPAPARPRFIGATREQKRRRLMELIGLARSRRDSRPDPEVANMSEDDLLAIIGATPEEFDAACRGLAEQLLREGRRRGLEFAKRG